MSAFFVEKAIIDKIVTTALAALYVEPRDATRAGRALWTENLRSLEARYPDHWGSRSAVRRGTLKEIAAYAFEHRAVTSATALKALDCYAYQTCEHADWPVSYAFVLVKALSREMGGEGMRESEAYKAAKWGE